MPPESTEQNDRISQLASFLQVVEQLKKVERRCYFSGSDRAENSAEHSWHLAMFLIVLNNDLPKQLDQLKMLKMAIIHDLVEIYAGDTLVYDETAVKTQKDRECAAADKLFEQLPVDMKKEFVDLFDEFENQETEEARTVKSFDSMQAVLQNLCSDWKSYKKHDISPAEMDNYNRKFMEHNKFILSVYEHLLDEARKKRYL